MRRRYVRQARTRGGKAGPAWSAPRCLGTAKGVPSFPIQHVAVKSPVSDVVTAYDRGMPRIWSQTIEAHRDAVREATLDATAALVAEHGLTGVTMSQIAKDTGIGRATLYKYFPDVESILRAWHERQIDEHLKQLLHIRDRTDGAMR